MTQDNTCSDIEKAIMLEASGQAYYMKCAAGTLQPTGRRMFESFAAECHADHDKLERLYANYFKQEYAEYKRKPPAHTGCFDPSRLGSTLDDEMTISAALMQAIKDDTLAGEHYKKLADASIDKTCKKFYLGISEEKMHHVQIMQMQVAFVKGTGAYTEYK